MTVRNLQVDGTGDLIISKGNLQLVSDGSSIQQAVQIQLNTVLGEYFLDDPVSPKVGVPYFQSVLVKNPNPDLLRKVFYDSILSVRGVRSVTELDLLYNSKIRTLTIFWRAITNSGDLIGGQTGS